MDNMETDLRRCVEHIKHVHRELEQLEKEVGSVLDKYEKAKAFNSMQQRRDRKKETQPAPATPVPKQPVAAVPVQPIPVSTPPTPASVQKEVPVTAENVMQEIVNTPVVEVKEPVQEVKESVQKVKEVQVASVPRPENKEKTVKKPVEKFDFERTIGKVLMGIFASVLVFVTDVLTHDNRNSRTAGDCTCGCQGLENTDGCRGGLNDSGKNKSRHNSENGVFEH